MQRRRDGAGEAAAEAAPPARPRDEVGTLLVRTARGDERAFGDLYDAVAPRVYGLCLRLVRDPAQAEEVCQEVLLEIWRTAARYRPERGSGLVWVLTVTHRRAVDRVRSAEARRDRERRAGGPPGGGVVDDVLDTVAARLEYQRVRRCLGTLTAVQRQAIDLAYYGGRTYREVAESLDVALPTVKSRMRDALIRLRDCLEVSRR
ncbi:RNA polymerase sigma factor SigK [Actinocatenispora thailandica]|uniref:RNA polymerase sigma factor SigK n=1 Tax=Actinocatenispora thailandica TaxID=227318 RepID=A0A7R7HWK0_9ACTN|nr:ECF RNA polymerase sigma factor SigK [Actinocatenispora thailandica]BCJ34193.1 RNA polymerase sigma factor SigK [Actinocatenispora thailandica]